jgi:hypothetical protein
MPNPSELARLDAEYDELINKLASYAPKSTKEGWLRELRQLERQLGYESRNYNRDGLTGLDGENAR